MDAGPGWLTVEMTSDDARVTRRWFADPATRLLLARWRNDRLTVPQGVTPADALRAVGAGDSAALAASTREAWQLRLPGVLLAYATGEGRSVSVPRSCWTRIAHDAAIATEPPRERVSGARGAWRRLHLPEEARILRETKREGDGAKARRAAKQAAARRIEELSPTSSPRQQALRKWTLFALQSERGRVGRGYEPATVASYLHALAGLFIDWPDVCPLSADPTELACFLDERLEGPASAFANAACSFARFYNSAGPAEPMEVDGLTLEQANHATAPMVLPAVYARALRLLRQAGDADAALALVLSMRTGMRAEEVAALRIGDFVTAADRLELVLAANDERTLKTRTSRRIIPLDALLEPDERRLLEDRLVPRRAARAVAGEGWLFGPLGQASVPQHNDLRKRIEAALGSASGTGHVPFRALRHSFASYLLATLLLPRDASDPFVPASLATAVSRERADRVSDRLLGTARLGAGAVHAVSQLMGHVGPRTTLHSYCHLLDLTLGQYVARPGGAGLEREAVNGLLSARPDARRKGYARARLGMTQPAAKAKSYAPPGRSAVERNIPGIADAVAAVRLISAEADRLSRSFRRERALEAEAEAAKNEPGARTVLACPASQYVVPWRLIAALASQGFAGDLADAVGHERVRHWQAQIEGHRRHWPSLLAYLQAPDSRKQRLLLDRLPTLPCPLSQPERRALAAARWSVLRREGRIRLKRLADARAFATLLRLMGFRDKEVDLQVTNLSQASFPHGRVKAFLFGEITVPELTGRHGWRGSLIVRFRPADGVNPRLFARTCRTALMMLALDR